MFQQHRIEFAGWPDHRFYRVPTQSLEGLYALIAVDHQIAVRLSVQGDHHDGSLLAMGSERCQQALLSIRTACPPRLPPEVELVKLQSHRNFGAPPLVCTNRPLVLCGRWGKFAGKRRGI